MLENKYPELLPIHNEPKVGALSLPDRGYCVPKWQSLHSFNTPWRSSF